MLFLFKNICLQVTILTQILVYFSCYRKMEVNSATPVCFLCKEDVSGDDAVTVTRGLENLIIVSKERKDNHHLFLEK